MCGIVGLYCKTPEMEARLGEHLTAMLIEMTDRGPDSAGVACYRDPVPQGWVKLTVTAHRSAPAWEPLLAALANDLQIEASLSPRGNHAVIKAQTEQSRLCRWLAETHPQVNVVSAGDTIEIFKETGLPKDVAAGFGLRELSGTHGLGHTRMATESAVTSDGSHPFSTGLDLCLVHNGSLSNHNRLRRTLQRKGVEFKTLNDSEVAAGYLTWRLSEGDSLEAALDRGIGDLDGFYTFAVGTRDGFAVLRDPVSCKHAVMAETDDWVAMATEFRAIAHLPNADHAAIWEPKAGQVYSWSRH